MSSMNPYTALTPILSPNLCHYHQQAENQFQVPLTCAVEQRPQSAHHLLLPPTRQTPAWLRQTQDDHFQHRQGRIFNQKYVLLWFVRGEIIGRVVGSGRPIVEGGQRGFYVGVGRHRTGNQPWSPVEQIWQGQRPPRAPHNKNNHHSNGLHPRTRSHVVVRRLLGR